MAMRFLGEFRLKRAAILFVIVLAAAAAAGGFWYYSAIEVPRQERAEIKKRLQAASELFQAKYCLKTPYSNETIRKFCEHPDSALPL